MIQIFGLARVGRDAVLRYTQENKPVAGVALAFSYGQKDQGGKRPTQWVEASIWGKRAESLTPYLLQGTRLAVTIDDAHIETYPKNDGSQGVKLVGTISNLEFAGSPTQVSQAPVQQHPAPQRTPAQAAQPPHRQATSLADMDSDIPF